MWPVLATVVCSDEPEAHGAQEDAACTIQQTFAFSMSIKSVAMSARDRQMRRRRRRRRRRRSCQASAVQTETHKSDVHEGSACRITNSLQHGIPDNTLVRTQILALHKLSGVQAVPRALGQKSVIEAALAMSHQENLLKHHLQSGDWLCGKAGKMRLSFQAALKPRHRLQH